MIYDPLLCGEYLLVFQKPVPWAWSKSLKKIEMPAKIIRFKILCNESKVCRRKKIKIFSVLNFLTLM